MATLKELQKLGLLSEGDLLVWKRKSNAQNFEAVVGKNGTIILSSGKVFTSPTAAAKELNGGVSVNGWKAWRLKSTGKYLAELRPNATAGGGN